MAPCGAFRHFIDWIATMYHIFRIFFVQLAGVTIFSKVDLVRGYHQVLVHLEDVSPKLLSSPYLVCLCSCRCHLSLRSHILMPDGFSALIHCLLFVYLDDILVASSSVDEHLSHLR